jgi:outer membrane protein assembly factor BamE (lipoprotein component of BamABCDE complex)
VSAAKSVARGIGKTIKWLVFGVFAFVAIIIVVAVIGLGRASNDANTQSANVSAHISEIHLGMTRSQVRAILGKPDSTQHSETAGLGTDDEWYYGTLSAKGSYQFVFQNGKLSAKNRY